MLLFILTILIGWLLTSKPVSVIFSTKTFAEPSRIGTSLLLISITALSIPNINNAPIKCSIVETLTPKSFEIVVQKFALETLKIPGIIILFSLRSVLLKIIPLLGWADFIVKSTIFPVCRPIPLKLMSEFTVFWLKLCPTASYALIVI